MEKIVKCKSEYHMGKKVIKNILPTKVCMFYKFSEAIFSFSCLLLVHLHII